MPKRALVTPEGRLHVWSTSGVEVAAFWLEELDDVQMLKQRLQKFCGVSRFRQRILNQQSILADDAKLADDAQLDLPLHLQLVLLPFCDTSTEQRDELFLAVQGESTGMVEVLLQRPQDPNLLDAFGRSALFEAARTENVHIAGLLLEAGCDPNGPCVSEIARGGQVPNDQTPLVYSAAHGSADMVRLLLTANADPDRASTKTGSRSIHQVLYSQDETNGWPLWKDWELVESKLGLLLEFRANVDAPDRHGRTPLYLACCIEAPCRSHLVELLVAAKANTNLADDDQSTPLHCACERGCVDTVRCLLQNGARCTLKDCFGRTALHAVFASLEAVPYSRAVDLLRLLLKAKANQDAVDDQCGTALHYALTSKDGAPLLVRCLLDAGARMEVADKNGLTALQCALQQTTSTRSSGLRTLFQSLPRPSTRWPRLGGQ